jgi:hypothetical protein
VSAFGTEPNYAKLFSQFDEEAWQQWMEAWLAGIEAEPRIEVYDGNLLEALVSLYRALPESRARLALANAAGMLLNTTLVDDSSSFRLSTLIGFVSFARPTSGRAVIRKLLKMSPTWFVSEPLASIRLEALNAAGRYGLDPWLLGHVMTEYPGATLQHNLACFRILAQNSRARDAFAVLDRIVPQVKSKAEEAALRIELTDGVRLLGCVGLLRYALDRQLEFKYDKEWASSEDYVSNAIIAAFRRHLTANDLADFLESWASSAGAALVPLLAELYMVNLPDGGRLWTLEDLDDGQFALIVRGTLHRLSVPGQRRIVKILQGALDRVEQNSKPDVFDFDIVASNLRFEEFRKVEAVGRVQ